MSAEHRHICQRCDRGYSCTSSHSHKPDTVVDIPVFGTCDMCLGVYNRR